MVKNLYYEYTFLYCTVYSMWKCMQICMGKKLVTNESPWPVIWCSYHILTNCQKDPTGNELPGYTFLKMTFKST